MTDTQKTLREQIEEAAYIAVACNQKQGIDAWLHIYSEGALNSPLLKCATEALEQCTKPLNREQDLLKSAAEIMTERWLIANEALARIREAQGKQ